MDAEVSKEREGRGGQGFLIKEQPIFHFEYLNVLIWGCSLGTIGTTTEKLFITIVFIYLFSKVQQSTEIIVNTA